MSQLVALSYCCRGVTVCGLPGSSSTGCRVSSTGWVLGSFPVLQLVQFRVDIRTAFASGLSQVIVLGLTAAKNESF